MYRLICIPLFLLLLWLPSEASWTRITQMNDPIGCGYAITTDTVLIGSGSFNGTIVVPSYELHIWRTVNGGVTWTQSTSPSGTGRVTSIYMFTSRIGYASLYSDDYCLWKTTDGGKSWFDITGSEIGRSISVAATSKALLKTMWLSVSSGGSSRNDGVQFDDVFTTLGSSQMNALAFADDNNGIATFGPHTDTDPTGCLYTTNGGVSWNRGGELGESWGLYAVKGTQTFIASPEGNGGRPLRIVRITTNGGISWTNRAFFPFTTNFTGAIAGGGTSVYLQTTTATNQGLYRSDDLGITWKSVGGPENDRDTRFVVTGCNGEVVYAFDNVGGIWKTTNGGDGTLLGAAPLNIGTIASVSAGDTASIPIYLNARADTFSISNFTVHLNYNTDMLSCINYDIVNTLASPIKNANFTNDASGVSFTCEMKNAITNASDLSKPLIRLVMQTYLSRELSTMVRLDTMSVDSQPPQPLCTIPQQTFEIKYECGDSLLSRFIKDSKIPKILSINPNPVGGENDLSIGIYLPMDSPVAIDIVDMNGNIVLSTNRNSYVAGAHTITINARPLLTGAYIMRLHTANAAIITEKFLVRK